jgi:hypothetical protein
MLRAGEKYTALASRDVGRTDSTVTRFQGDLVKSAPMTLPVRERGSDVGRHELTRELGADHSPTQHQNVHVVGSTP